MTFWHIRHRHAVMRVLFPHGGIITDALGNPQRVIASIRNHMIPALTHFGCGFNVIAVAVELKAIRVLERLAGLHTQHRLVGFGLRLQDIVAVVGHQRRQVQAFADL